jgi:hypothetical protein
VEDCDRQVTVVMQIVTDIVKSNEVHRRMLQVPLCPIHAEEMMSTDLHPGASFYRPDGPLFRRAVVIEPRLVMEAGDLLGTKDERRWPTYQQLLRMALAGAEKR